MEMLQGKAGQKLQPTSSLANLSKLRGLLEPSQSSRSISVYSRKFPTSSPKCLRQSSHDFPMSKNTPDPLILKSGLFRLKELDKYLFSNDLVTLEEIISRQQRYRQQATQIIPYLKIMLTKQVLAGYFCHKNKQWKILGSQRLERWLIGQKQGLEFGYQQPSQVAHNHPKLHLPGIHCPLLASPATYTHT